MTLFFSLFSHQPSNSGRAAELLAKEQGTVPGFIGFGTSQSDLGYVPAIQGAEEIDSLVDSDFRMVLRKLSKKDVTTKLKASFFVLIKAIKKIFLLKQNVVDTFFFLLLLLTHFILRKMNGYLSLISSFIMVLVLTHELSLIYT